MTTRVVRIALEGGMIACTNIKQPKQNYIGADKVQIKSPQLQTVGIQRS
jgi:hypothetical protein